MERKRLTSLLMILTFSIFGLLLGSDLFAKDKQKRGFSREELLIAHVKNSLHQAEKTAFSLNSAILHIDSRSSPKIGCFLNHLCTLADTCYLEIGCRKGATLAAALFHNESNVAHAIAIDLWAEKEETRADFLHNIETFIPNAHLRIYDTDCFQIKNSEVFPRAVNIYFYDGSHKAPDQEMAFTYFNDVFDDLFIAIVNDWNSPGVELASRNAFQKLGYQILYEKKLNPNINRDHSFWKNELYIAVIKKKSCNCY